ncbi:ABC-F family ATP-binding cassette domain-containing protein [Streptomyces sp. WMMB303]|uniref:ABC-F family ATP-binding cassette domain-containing protein n=1 Tax=Streptomyces sp. WMMB303 TaxID=3034154 RepID=UPI0023EC0179|nr:ABC-F family ATP-binding cassette domain-containing protein [Streptomyces sp. WMMB303]MDF4252434.1 ABC-F family ATP-binding cassette domain-containing protein [Streptomyces sp. WMMB303]
MTTSAPSLSCSRLTFSWPDGTRLLTDFDLSVGPGRTGLIGLNGTGKSTLLRLLAGELRPDAGSVTVRGEVGYLPQNLTLDTSLRVDEALGVARTRAALHAIEAGDVSEEQFTAVGDDWDVEERARVTLDHLGLSHIGLDHTIGEMSGGESVLLRLAALLLARPDVLLLDEPTNNLDRTARRRLHEAVSSFRGVLVVVSHDRELLALVDRIADLRGGEVTWYGGDLEAYEAAVSAEQQAAERMVRAAETDVRRQRRELAEARMKLARRAQYGSRQAAAGSEPKILLGARKRQAQETAGRHRLLHEQRLDEARQQLEEASERVRDDSVIRVDLPSTAVPRGRRVLEMREVELRHGPRIDLDVHGPDRIALVGPNGAGKTTLLRTLAGQLPAAAGEVHTHVPLRYLPQRLTVLDDRLSVVENVAHSAPQATNQQIRARLARFLLRGKRADRAVGTLSGGERFRAALAAVLLADPAPQLLMLDEPTNNLDESSVRQLREALTAYEGALLIASHDLPFLRELSITRWLGLRDGTLLEAAPQELGLLPAGDD